YPSSPLGVWPSAPMSIAGSSPGCGRSRPSESSAASPSAASRSWLSTSLSRWPPARPAYTASSCPGPDASCSTPPRTLHIVRRRLDGIAVAAGAMLANLDIQVITAPALRLDLEVDRRNLAETVDRLRPRLLILDPFVRLHRIDENASGEVALRPARSRQADADPGTRRRLRPHIRGTQTCAIA